MADVPYGQGVPDVNPQTDAPNDYQDVQPRAAQGLVALGQGASKAGDFFNNVASDDAFNEFQDGITKILRGDPNKMVPSANGMVPDTGYLGLKGRSALDARPAVQQQMDDLLTQIRGGLQNPEQELAFDTASRRYRSSAMLDIGAHADDQANTWYTTVNAASEKNAVDTIANNPDDPQKVAAGLSDLTNARLKQAQLNGAQPGDPIWTDTVNQSRRDAATTQIQAIGATDPARAMRVLQNYKGILGTSYDNLYDALKDKSDHEIGTNAGEASWANGNAQQNAATPYASAALPVYQQTAQAIPGGYSQSGIARTVQLESNGDPTVVNASGHVGLGQFSPETWKEYGVGDPKNPDDAIAAIQRYAAANSQYLTPKLGRPPTDAELYIAHQQGPGGAAALLTHPNASAASLIGLQAVKQNLPWNMQPQAATMTAAEFTSYWGHKFGGTTPPQMAQQAPTAAPPTPAAPQAAAPQATAQQPAVANANVPAAPAPNPLPGEAPTAAAITDPKALAYQGIMADDSLSPEQKEIAIQHVNQLAQAQVTAEALSAAAVKKQSDDAAGGYMTQILTGQNTADLGQMIAQDPKLEWQTKESLTSALQAHAQSSASAATASYGPGFWSAYQQVTAPTGDPSRISDVGQILRRAGPGGDLTLAGANQLVQTMTQNQRSVDDQSVSTTKTDLLAYAKSKISFDTSGMPDIPGAPQLRDPQGERIFNAQFVPKFLSAYDQWVKSGKDPWQFLTQDNVDKMIGGMRDPRSMALAKLEAQSSVDPSQVPVRAPEGVDQDGWNEVLSVPVVSKSGTPIQPAQWAEAVRRLQANPSDDVKKAFDNHFGNAVVNADDILSILKPLGTTDEQAKAARQSNAANIKERDAGFVPSAPSAAVVAPTADTVVMPAGLGL